MAHAYSPPQDQAIEDALAHLKLQRSWVVADEVRGWLFAFEHGLVTCRGAERKASPSARRALRLLREGS